MITFSDLTRKLIDEQLKQAVYARNWKRPDEPLEGYTVEDLNDIESLLDKSNNFSEVDDKPKFAKLGQLLKQSDVKTNKSKGICLLVSLFNAYPWIFMDSKEILERLVNELDDNNYADSVYIKDLVNQRLSRSESRPILLRQTFDRFKLGTLNEIKNSIDKGIVIPMGYDNLTSGHNVNVIGYGLNYLYYFDNSEEEHTMLLLDVLEIFVRAIYSKYKQSKKKKSRHYEIYCLLDKRNDFVNLRDFYYEALRIMKSKMYNESVNYSNIGYSWLNCLHNIDLLVLNDAIAHNFSGTKRY